jgi:hypothetical protein
VTSVLLIVTGVLVTVAAISWMPSTPCRRLFFVDRSSRLPCLETFTRRCWIPPGGTVTPAGFRGDEVCHGARIEQATGDAAGRVTQGGDVIECRGASVVDPTAAIGGGIARNGAVAERQ